MLLIQQSLSFRAWTSRALMIYFRRALLFLVVSPCRYKNCLLQEQDNVYFSDAEDDEEILINDNQKKIENSFKQIEINQLKKYVFNKRSQGLNNSIKQSIENYTINTSSFIDSTDQSSLIFDSVQLPITEQVELSTCSSKQDFNSSLIKTINNTKINETEHSIYQYQTNPLYPSCQQTSSNHYNQINTLPLSSICHSFDKNKPSLSKSFIQYSPTSIEKNLPELSNNENDIYEKYQNSFSHILHQIKSPDTIRKEEKLQSVSVLEPNTSVITVRQLTYHHSNPTNINYSMITTHICVRLIVNQTDLSTQSDTKPIGCQKSLINHIIQSISNEQQESSLKTSLLTSTQQFSNKKLKATSILIDTPYKILYIDL